uniref:Fe2OG dioxygenase domain-containing protein n=1 Tax=Ananas comosus var. bracteatus TaxID=296719 RepID=A0A6V7PF62_ANACO|nr:unnamed protein product [Ananas comosus var. bracteatus]
MGAEGGPSLGSIIGVGGGAEAAVTYLPSDWCRTGVMRSPRHCAQCLYGGGGDSCGALVNVVKGLKVYEDIFMDSELLRLSEFINELRQAGRNGELSGETFIFFNKQMKGNKREIIQLGVPLFQPTNEDATCSIDPIPQVLQGVIDHLVQWRLIPESRKPNSCIINFFDEDEYSQPYYKPPHLDNPISTLLLSETTMAFGRSLVSDHNGNYKGPLTLTLKQGSLLVMRGHSADMARHVVCPSSNHRVSITFVRVKPAAPSNAADPSSAIPSPTKAISLWQPGTPPPLSPQKTVSGGGAFGYGASHAMIPAAAWGMALRAPVVMLAPMRPVMMSPGKRMARGGTGVFLPWTVGPKKYTKHLPRVSRSGDSRPCQHRWKQRGKKFRWFASLLQRKSDV